MITVRAEIKTMKQELTGMEGNIEQEMREGDDTKRVEIINKMVEKLDERVEAQNAE